MTTKTEEKTVSPTLALYDSFSHLHFPGFHFNEAATGDGDAGNGGSDGAEGAGGTTDGDTGGSGDGDALALAIAKAVEEATKGLKDKNVELLGKLKKKDEDLKALSKQPKISDDELKFLAEVKERMERDNLAKLMLEGKSDEVIETVTKRTRAELQAKIDAVSAEKTAAEQKAEEALRRYEEMLVNIEVTRAAGTTVKPAYQELVAKLVKENTQLIDGAVRVVDKAGEVVTTAKGEPMTVEQYVEGLRPTMPDLFVGAAGGGAGGSGNKGPGSRTTGKVSVEDSQNLSDEEWIRLRREGKIG